MIELDDVTVDLPPGRPQAKSVLKNLSLTIGDGEWVAVTGPNGSGKSTFLRTLAGLCPPVSGRVRGDGAASVGLLLQEPDNQFVSQSVRTDLALSLDPSLDARTRRERIEAAVERFSLGRLLDRNPHRISGGEKQRLALATIWLSDPGVILLDEPVSYLDAQERARSVAFVRELNRQGVTVVWATPGGEDLCEARRVVHLDGGKIAFDGEAAQFIDRARANAFDVLLPGEEEPASRARDDLGPGNPGEPVILGRAISFSYDDVAVFRDVNFHVREAEAVGIAGRNGSGKSTLLAMMAGVLEPSGGTIERRYDKAVARVAGRRTQQVFFMYQSPERLFFAETVLEEVAFGLESLGVPRSDIPERAARALAGVGLDPAVFLVRSPFSLSLGEMRRLSFAIAYALDPKFLLLDEPASCLDRAGKEILRDLVAAMRSMGGAVVIASHDPSHLRSTVGRCFTLAGGTLSGS